MRASLRNVLLATITMCGVGALSPLPAQANVFNFTSCHLSGGCRTATQFGTVMLTQSGTSVNFDVMLNSGNRFVETGAGGNSLFLFNDSIAGSTITNITATLNGATISVPSGLSGFTNETPVMADGTGTFTASVQCTVFAECNGKSAPNMNDLHFTVTNVTLAQLETRNDKGNFFVADILCGQTGCTGKTGDVDVSTSAVSTSAVPEPSTWAALILGFAGIGLVTYRRKREIAVRLA